jgi:hypothetical protein
MSFSEINFLSKKLIFWNINAQNGDEPAAARTAEDAVEDTAVGHANPRNMASSPAPGGLPSALKLVDEAGNENWKCSFLYY